MKNIFHTKISFEYYNLVAYALVNFKRALVFLKCLTHGRRLKYIFLTFRLFTLKKRMDQTYINLPLFTINHDGDSDEKYPLVT